MRKVLIAGDNIITSLGFTTPENISKLKSNTIGFHIRDNSALSPVPIPLSLVDQSLLDDRFNDFIREYDTALIPANFTRLEKMFLYSIHQAIKGINLDLTGKRSLLILSTTKGNIDLLEESNQYRFDKKRLYLWEMAEVIRQTYGFFNRPLIISNACISGVLGIGIGYRYLQSGLYDHAVVCGGDILSQFVISGFQSFQSLSAEPCKPYDIARNGLSLGEACGTIVLTYDPEAVNGQKVMVEATSTSNDANHISGPSRTGEELNLAIRNALGDANVAPEHVDFISAHGTATLFNDEMEAKAFALAGLNGIPVNSFKGYWGHTLGAAGLIESVASIHSMLENTLFRSAGFTEPGISEKLNIIAEHYPATIRKCLKTASGFGGCNAALVFSKEEN